MQDFIDDVRKAGPAAKREAGRELAVTVGVALSVFVIGPLVSALLVLPTNGIPQSLFDDLSGSEIYIAAVSLLSIAIYSISKEYNIDRGRYLGFPHAVTILLLTVLVLIISFSVCTAHVVYEAMKPELVWRGLLAGGLGWLLFVGTSAFAYGVLVLRYDMETGSAHRTREDEEGFVANFEAARKGDPGR
jgi:hypothetical protein